MMTTYRTSFGGLTLLLAACLLLFFDPVTDALNMDYRATKLPLSRQLRSSLQLNMQSGNMGREYRTAIGALSLLGGAETSYLTISKLSNSPIASSLCTGGSCNSVLSSPFATIPIINLPLTAVGFLAYATIFFLSITPMLSSSDDRKSLEDNATSILFLSAAMATFRSFVIQYVYIFCILI